MSSVDATQLSAIRERADAATPGPWARPTANVFRVIAPDAEHHNPSQGMTPPYPWRIICQEGEDDANGVNAEFIAHARSDIPALLDEVERLHTALAFYADEANWKTRVIYEAPAPGPNAGAQMWESGLAADRGAAARAALRTDPEGDA